MKQSELKTICVNGIMKQLRSGKHKSLTMYKRKELGIHNVYTSEVLMERVLRRMNLDKLYEIRRTLANS